MSADVPETGEHVWLWECAKACVRTRVHRECMSVGAGASVHAQGVVTDVYGDSVEDSFHDYCNILSLQLYSGRFFRKVLNKDYF